MDAILVKQRCRLAKKDYLTLQGTRLASTTRQILYGPDAITQTLLMRFIPMPSIQCVKLLMKTLITVIITHQTTAGYKNQTKETDWSLGFY